jgi:quercetin dioxygenase-like cupin family protein
LEIIVTVVEYPPGAVSPLHTHPGEEAFYVLEGATLETPDGKTLTPVTGGSRINVRDLPHGAFTETGDKTFKLLAVHIVDKGKTVLVPVKP